MVGLQNRPIFRGLCFFLYIYIHFIKMFFYDNIPTVALKIEKDNYITFLIRR